MKYLLWLAVCSGQAFAHVPYVEGLDFKEGESFTQIDSIEKSLAIYSAFNYPGDVDEMTFTLTPQDLENQDKLVTEGSQRGRRLSFDTIVPRCLGNLEVLPSIAVVGPIQGLLVQDNTSLETLPFSVKPGEGTFITTNDSQGETFKEEIGGTYYWQQKRSEILLTQPGDYHIYIWNRTENVGDYTFVIGREEVFGIPEIIQSFKRIGFIRRGKEINDAQCRKEAKKSSATL